MKAKGRARSTISRVLRRHRDQRLGAGHPLRPRFLRRDHVLFGTDCPFDPLGGPLFIREIIKAIDSLDLPEAVRDKVYHENAHRMLRLKA